MMPAGALLASRRMARWVRGICLLLGGLVALAGLWLAGFAWFVQVAWTATAAPPPQADGIVALTGGSERVETALRLLAGDRARLLLISGVGGTTDFAALAHRAGVDPGLGERVTLGRNAASTRGNAVETAEWAHANAIRSVIVVTAAYHMPRALAELSRALPEATLHPVPVVPQALRQQGAGALRLLASEYTKWLAAEVGLSALASRSDAHPPAREEKHGG
ncbi:YdcF family protein [Rhodovastum atsumiense]|uniref:YdcF family protein n=1 Tax=Rhodovastum atsumiense TaxID=504468 RepID=A0A5M6IY35_9PROT|nr:YdcF family protein [Rhodovastum atsumiense]KAA5613266.1 YdcF family protein [Rhodovastum atsumiense]CAH2600571.1 YdcF family protein [Rhodovastum atsumiense]